MPIHPDYPELGDPYVREDGKVAVLLSSNYGGGWSHYCGGDIYDAFVVRYLLGKDKITIDDLRTYFATCVDYRERGPSVEDVEGLVVEWVPLGTQFRINIYDGKESIEYRDNAGWRTATAHR